MTSKHYETVFILSPLCQESIRDEVVTRFEGIIKSNQGTVVSTDNWGLKELSFTVRKQNTGYYFSMEFSGPGIVVSALETAYKREENILRYLIVALDKHAVDYNERRRKGLVGNKKTLVEENV